MNAIQPEQLTLDRLWPCPTCDGKGVRPNPETDRPARCLVCDGSGTVTYDPDDRTIPF